MRYFDDKPVDPPRQRILICGDRDYKDWMKIQDYLYTVSRTAIIIHGGARGADSLYYPLQAVLAGGGAGDPNQGAARCREG